MGETKSYYYQLDKNLSKWLQPQTQPMPKAETLDGYLNEIIPVVRSWSEDLREEKFYLSKPWMEMRDEEDFHSSVLHFFNEGGEYMKSIDGDVSIGKWRYLSSSNKFIITPPKGDPELYELAFLDSQFFILRKHGDQVRLGKRKYFVLVIEPLGRKIEWKHVPELLFNQYRDTNNFYLVVGIVIVLIIIIILVLSSF